MKKLLGNNFFKIFLLFLIWRIGLFVLAYLAQFALPVYGARFPYFDRVLVPTGLPNWIWGFGGFDGVHYLRIAQNGYNADFSQAFFPGFPLTIRFIGSLLPNFLNLERTIYVDPKFFWVGLILSNVFFVSGLMMLYKLLRLDFSKKISWLSVILLLVFPTSFYFGAIYTEGLFLLIMVSCLYFYRKRRYLSAGMLAVMASVTRIFGVLFLVPAGLFGYMYFLQSKFGDALMFLHSQPAFGADRSTSIILLPQVYWRYAKIFVTTKVFSGGFNTAMLEFGFTTIFAGLLIWGYKKMRRDYWFLSLGMFLLPTLTGTFSSMPRYVLMCFLIFPYLVKNLSNEKLKVLYVLMALLQIVLVGLFVRGYWIA